MLCASSVRVYCSRDRWCRHCPHSLSRAGRTIMASQDHARTLGIIYLAVGAFLDILPCPSSRWAPGWPSTPDGSCMVMTAGTSYLNPHADQDPFYSTRLG